MSKDLLRFIIVLLGAVFLIWPDTLGQKSYLADEENPNTNCPHEIKELNWFWNQMKIVKVCDSKLIPTDCCRC